MKWNWICNNPSIGTGYKKRVKIASCYMDQVVQAWPTWATAATCPRSCRCSSPYLTFRSGKHGSLVSATIPEYHLSGRYFDRREEIFQNTPADVSQDFHAQMYLLTLSLLFAPFLLTLCCFIFHVQGKTCSWSPFRRIFQATFGMFSCQFNFTQTLARQWIPISLTEKHLHTW